MMLVDYVVWAAILVGGLVLSVWYGVSWRAVAKALAEPTPSTADRPRGRAVTDETQDAQIPTPSADVLVEART